MYRILALLLAVSITTSSAFTAKCGGTVCTLDGSKSTGVIDAWRWTVVRGGKDSTIGAAKVITFDFRVPGVDTVRLYVRDAASQHWYYHTGTLTVSAVAVPPAGHVDTLRLPPIHDTVRVYVPVHDTIRVTLHDTIAVQTTLPSPLYGRGIYAIPIPVADGQPPAQSWRVMRLSLCGTVDLRERRYRTYGAAGDPIAGRDSSRAFPLAGTFATLDSSVAAVACQ